MAVIRGVPQLMLSPVIRPASSLSVRAPATLPVMLAVLLLAAVPAMVLLLTLRPAQACESMAQRSEHLPEVWGLDRSSPSSSVMCGASPGMCTQQQSAYFQNVWPCTAFCRTTCCICLTDTSALRNCTKRIIGKQLIFNLCALMNQSAYSCSPALRLGLRLPPISSPIFGVPPVIPRLFRPVMPCLGRLPRASAGPPGAFVRRLRGCQVSAPPLGGLACFWRAHQQRQLQLRLRAGCVCLCHLPVCQHSIQPAHTGENYTCQQLLRT